MKFDAQLLYRENKGSEWKKLCPTTLLVSDGYLLHIFLRHGNQIAWIQKTLRTFLELIGTLREYEKNPNFLGAELGKWIED